MSYARCPDSFSRVDDLLGGWTGAQTMGSVANALRGQKRYALYTSEGCAAHVWWDPKREEFLAEVHRYKTHIGTPHAKTLRGLIERIGHGALWGFVDISVKEGT